MDETDFVFLVMALALPGAAILTAGIAALGYNAWCWIGGCLYRWQRDRAYRQVMSRSRVRRGW